MKSYPSRSAYAVQSDLVLAIACIEQRPAALIDEAFHQSLIQAEAAIRTASANLQHALTAKRHAATERLRFGKVLIRTVRDFNQGLKRAVNRIPGAGPWQDVYACRANMPKDNTLTSEWYEQARQIGAAHASTKAKLAEEAGAPQLANPSAEDVAATLPEAVAADEAWRAASRTLKQRQASLRQAHAEGMRLLVSLRLRIRTMAQGLSLPARYSLMHNYGVRLKAERQKMERPAQRQTQNLTNDRFVGGELAQIPA